MRLRKLKIEDAPLMLEWMHDDDVCEFMQRDFKSMTIENCEDFIRCSREDYAKSLHMAVVNNDDEYMGTVSLKNIDRQVGEAEFAITMRKSAMGKGYASFAMKEIINLGLKNGQLQKIFWCVAKDNIRANRFYDKNGYQRMSLVPDKYKEIYQEWERMNWYCVLSD